ncbi:hypothetical protein [Opitutus sp. ER46]|uniref:hypothetical protein n=1 Tax=Opitutus sp. ER46 TaxID=2161864 RepID=UPI000D2FF2B1|nr:hypothetical protein [Opitutus sp. ER46]PTX91691.1 hypothetical protein DB354_17655 [Opitutus sp. ER46]
MSQAGACGSIGAIEAIVHARHPKTSKTARQRADACRHQILGAAGLAVFIGVATMAEPILRVTQNSGLTPGLLLPEVVFGSYFRMAGAMGHVLAAAACGALLVLLGILTGLGRKRAVMVAALVVVCDWPLALLAGNASNFPQIITSVLRFLYLFYLVRGYRAIGLREALQAESREAAEVPASRP